VYRGLLLFSLATHFSLESFSKYLVHFYSGSSLQVSPLLEMPQWMN